MNFDKFLSWLPTKIVGVGGFIFLLGGSVPLINKEVGLIVCIGDGPVESLPTFWSSLGKEGLVKPMGDSVVDRE